MTPESPDSGGPYPWSWRSGELVAHHELTVHAECLSMRYGLSAFEGVRGYRQTDGRVRYFALDEHLERLASTLETIQVPLEDPESAAVAARSLLEANSVEQDCYLRVAVNCPDPGTLGTRARGELYVTVRAMGRKVWLAQNRAMKIAIVERRKPADDVFPQRAKVISNYMGPRLAYLEARRQGCDQAVLLSAEGDLSEAPTSNLFLVHGGRLSTPREEDGILSGITRRHLILLARSEGLEVDVRRLSAADAYRADEAFLCGTGIELAPIGSFDGRVLPDERPVFDALVRQYFRLVRDPAAA